MIQIAVLGYGTVGSGVVEVINTNHESINKKAGEEINIKYVLDLRDFPGDPIQEKIVHDYEVIANDPEIRIIVEVMGGIEPAYTFVKRALESGKSVCTSNKELVAKHGVELLEIAKKNNINFLFEASCGGGIPIIRPMWQCLAANKIKSVAGILNGACNYILTKMEKEQTDFETALKQAQELGYAERNPGADIEGTDTCRKISILTSLAFGKHVYPDQLSCEGITKIKYDDISYASKHGFAIKLLGLSSRSDDGKVYAITAPYFVPKTNALAGVNDVYNGIQVVGNVVQDVFFCGRGAGSLPTASAVMADVLDIIRDCRKTIAWKNEKADFLGDIAANETVCYVRTKADIAAIKKIFGVNDIDEVGSENVFFTDKMPEKEIDSKLNELGAEYLKVRVLDK